MYLVPKTVVQNILRLFYQSLLKCGKQNEKTCSLNCIPFLVREECCLSCWVVISLPPFSWVNGCRKGRFRWGLQLYRLARDRPGTGVQAGGWRRSVTGRDMAEPLQGWRGRRRTRSVSGPGCACPWRVSPGPGTACSAASLPPPHCQCLFQWTAGPMYRVGGQCEEGWDGPGKSTWWFAELPLRQHRCPSHSPLSTVSQEIWKCAFYIFWVIECPVWKQASCGRAFAGYHFLKPGLGP